MFLDVNVNRLDAQAKYTFEKAGALQVKSFSQLTENVSTKPGKVWSSKLPMTLDGNVIFIKYLWLGICFFLHVTFSNSERSIA